MDLKRKLIIRGTKIIKMSMGNATFLDSLNFPMPLAKLSKSVAFPELKKGYIDIKIMWDEYLRWTIMTLII